MCSKTLPYRRAAVFYHREAKPGETEADPLKERFSSPGKSESFRTIVRQSRIFDNAPASDTLVPVLESQGKLF